MSNPFIPMSADALKKKITNENRDEFIAAVAWLRGFSKRTHDALVGATNTEFLRGLMQDAGYVLPPGHTDENRWPIVSPIVRNETTNFLSVGHGHNYPTAFWWLQREVLRVAYGVYADPHDTPVIYHLSRFAHTAWQMLHVSTSDPTRVAYTASPEDGCRDKQTVTTLGRWIRRNFPMLSDADVQALDAQHRADMDPTVPMTSDPDKIERIYQTMRGDTGCMRHAPSRWSLESHPAVLYGLTPGVSVAYHGLMGQHTARAVTYVNPDDPSDKRVVRLYGDAILGRRLEAQGYRVAGLAGAKLPAIPITMAETYGAASIKQAWDDEETWAHELRRSSGDSTTFLLPYLDPPGGRSSGTSEHDIVAVTWSGGRYLNTVGSNEEYQKVRGRLRSLGKDPDAYIAQVRNYSTARVELAQLPEDLTHGVDPFTGQRYERADFEHGQHYDVMIDGVIHKTVPEAVLERAGWIERRSDGAWAVGEHVQVAVYVPEPHDNATPHVVLTVDTLEPWPTDSRCLDGDGDERSLETMAKMMAGLSTHLRAEDTASRFDTQVTYDMSVIRWRLEVDMVELSSEFYPDTTYAYARDAEQISPGEYIHTTDAVRVLRVEDNPSGTDEERQATLAKLADLREGRVLDTELPHASLPPASGFTPVYRLIHRDRLPKGAKKLHTGAGETTPIYVVDDTHVLRLRSGRRVTRFTHHLHTTHNGEVVLASRAVPVVFHIGRLRVTTFVSRTDVPGGLILDGQIYVASGVLSRVRDQPFGEMLEAVVTAAMERHMQPIMEAVAEAHEQDNRCRQWAERMLRGPANPDNDDTLIQTMYWNSDYSLPVLSPDYIGAYGMDTVSISQTVRCVADPSFLDGVEGRLERMVRLALHHQAKFTQAALALVRHVQQATATPQWIISSPMAAHEVTE